VTGWIALVLIVAVVIVTAAAKARAAEFNAQKAASDAKDRMLEAGAAAPRDRDALADRLRAPVRKIMRPNLRLGLHFQPITTMI
jgi:hypothetical protein